MRGEWVILPVPIQSSRNLDEARLEVPRDPSMCLQCHPMMVLPEAKIRSRGQGSSGSIRGILVIGFAKEARKFYIGFSGERPLDSQGSLCQTPILIYLFGLHYNHRGHLHQTTPNMKPKISS